MYTSTPSHLPDLPFQFFEGLMEGFTCWLHVWDKTLGSTLASILKQFRYFVVNLYRCGSTCVPTMAADGLETAVLLLNPSADRFR